MIKDWRQGKRPENLKEVLKALSVEVGQSWVLWVASQKIFRETKKHSHILKREKLNLDRVGCNFIRISEKTIVMVLIHISIVLNVKLQGSVSGG